MSLFLLMLSFCFRGLGQTYTLGTFSSNSSASGITPFTSSYEDNRIQYLYLASELTAAGATAGNFQQIAFNFTTLGSPTPLGVNVKYALVPTATTNITALTTAGLTNVYAPGALTPTIGWNTWTLTSPIVWDGTSNILIEVCRDNAAWSTNYAVQVTNFAAGVSRTYGFYADAVTGCSMTSGTAASATNRRNRPLLRITRLSVCSGTPAPGNTVSSVSSACSGTNFTLSVQNATVGSGVTYQWEMADDAGFSVNFATLGTASTQVTSQTAAKYYRCKVTCAGNTGTSTPLQVTMNTLLNCYCAASNSSGGAGTDAILNVSIPSSSPALNSSTGGTAAPGYTSYSGPTYTVTVGTTHNLSITYSSDGNQYGRAWVDWNRDGDFLDANEDLGPQTPANALGGGVPAFITFTVPATTDGPVRLRVRGGNDGQPLSTEACGAVAASPWGEIEDYDLNVFNPPPCSGTPTPGQTQSSVASACSGVNFNLTTENSTPGLGVTYQWQSANDFAFSSGVTNLGTLSTLTTNQTAAKYYRCQVTCSGNTGTSTPILVSMSPGYSCFCTPSHGATGNCITGVIFNTLSNTTGTGCTLPSYTLFPQSGSTTTTLYQGQTYNLTVNTDAFTYVWAHFDINGNGVFDPSEQVQVLNGAATGTISISIPSTGYTGTALLRLRSRGFSSSDPCASFFAGESEDYLITIATPPPCTTPPAPGNTLSSTALACSGVNFTLSMSTPPTGTGLTYQWQSADDAGFSTGLTNLGTATTQITSQTTSKYYRCNVTCSGNTVASTPVQVTLNTFLNCYCATAATSAADEEIRSFSVDGISRDATYDACATVAPGPGSTLQRYSNFYTLGSIFTLSRTTSPPFVLVEEDCDGGTDYDFGTAIWIDFNQDGVFNDATEKVYAGPVTARGTDFNAWTISGNITIPNSALLGQTGMRVTIVEGVAGSAIISCNTYTYGETEDYLVDITAAPPCPSVTGLGSSSVTYSSATLGWTAATSGDAYEWELRKVSSGTSCGDLTGIEQSGVTASIATVSLNLSTLDASTDYIFCIRNVCSASSSSSGWTSTSFSTPCAPVTSFPYLEDFEGITLTGVSTTVFPACMTKQNVSGTVIRTGRNGDLMNGFSYPVVAASGTQAAYITYSSTNWMHTAPLNLTGGTTYYFSFLYRNATTSNGFTINSAVNTTPSIVGQTILGSPVVDPTSLTYGSKSVSYTPATSGTYYFSIGVVAAFAPEHLLIDDIEVSTTPPCDPPSDLAASAITATSATIDWSSVAAASGGYNWELRASGLCGSGSPVQSGTVGTNQVILSSLNPGSTYTICIRSACGGPTSGWSSISFNTNCPASFAPPQSEGFEGLATVGTDVLPACYSSETLGFTPISTNNSALRGTTARTGSNFLSSAYNQNNWFFFKPMALVGGTTYYFSYYHRVTDTYTGTGISYTAAVGTAANSGAMTTVLSTITDPQNLAYVLESVAYTPSTTGVYYFGLNANASGDFSSWYFAFDDISVSTIPPPKAITGVTVAQQTGSGVQGQNNVPVQRITISAGGVAGTISLNGVVATYTGTNVADVAGGTSVRIYKTATSSYVSPVLVGSVSMVGSTATFTGLGSALTTGDNYYWLTVDISNAATLGNGIDFSFASGSLTFTSAGGATAPGTLPAALANPTGSVTVQGLLAYQVQSSTGAYSPISGGTVLGTTTSDDEGYNNSVTDNNTGTGFPIGFNFTYAGSTFTTFAAHCNGYIQLGTGVSFTMVDAVSRVFGSTAAANKNILAAFSQDLQNQPGGELSYLLTGTAPNRKLTVQWSNFRKYLNPGSLNFQIVLNETSNTIDYNYGSLGLSADDFANIGIKGNRSDSSSTNYLVLSTHIGTQVPSTVQFENLVRAEYIYSSAQVEATNSISGLTYTFVPTACNSVPVSALSPTSVALTSATLNWTPNADYANGYRVRYKKVKDDVTASTYATPTTVAGAGTGSLALSSLEPNSIYMFEVQGICSGATSSEWSVPITFQTNPAASDLAVVQLNSPADFGDCFTSTTPIVATVRNTGLNTITVGNNIGITVSVVTPYGTVNRSGSGYVFSNIPVGGTFSVTVGSLDMTAVGNYTFTVTSNWAPDGNPANNVLSPAPVINGAGIGVPAPNYTLNFNAATAGMFQSYTAGYTPAWSRITGNLSISPSTSTVLAPQEGAGAFLFNDVSSSTPQNILITNCLQVASCYEASFYHSRFSGSTGTQGTEVVVSTDGGNTWSAALTLRSANTGKTTTLVTQYLATATVPVWEQFKFDLTAYAGQTIRIGFRAGSGFGLNTTNWAIDNLVISPKIENELEFVGVNIINSYATCNVTSIPVTATVRNNGCNALTNFSIIVNANGPLASSPTSLGTIYTATLAPGATATVSIGSLNITGGGSLSFSGTVNLASGVDGVPANNTLAPTALPLKSNPTVTVTVANPNLLTGQNASVTGTAVLGSSVAIYGNGTATAIPDNTGNANTSRTISLPATIPASALVSVRFSIVHPNVSDLRVTLRAPDLSTIDLVDQRGGLGANFMNTTFSSAGVAISTITAAQAPYSTTTYTPEQAFSTLTGLANGTWTLFVRDRAGQDIGTLLNWTISFNNQLATSSWTCPDVVDPAKWPVNQTAPIASVAYPNNPFGSTYAAGSYGINLTVTDLAGCSANADDAVNYYTTNIWTGVSSLPAGNNWNNGSNWIIGTVPVNTEAVTIPSGTPHAPSVSTTATVGTIDFTISNGLTFTNPSAVLNVRSNIIGGPNASVTGPGKIVLNGNAAQTLSGNGTFSNLEINKTTGSVNFSGVTSITGALTFNPASTTVANVTGTLKLASSATSTGRIGTIPAGSSITGNVTAERYIQGLTDGWYFLGSPILGKNFTDWSDDFKVYGPSTGFGSQGGGIVPISGEHSTILEYRENLVDVVVDWAQQRGWRAPGATSIESGRGYRTWIDASSNYGGKFENFGPVAQQIVSFPTLTRNSIANCSTYPVFNQAYVTAPCTEGDKGWNLLSNPYPSPINWDAPTGWTKPASINNAFYIWSGSIGQYQAYLGTTGTPGVILGGSTTGSTNTDPSVIPMSQGFFVKMVSGTTATMSVNENVKFAGTGSGTFVRTTVASNQIRLRLTASAVSNYRFDGMIRFDEGSTFGFDQNKDMHSISGGTKPEFSMASESGEGLLLNSVPVPTETRVIPVSVAYKGYNGNYTFTFLEQETIDNGVEIYLRDNYLGVITSMTASPSYTFNVSADGSDAADRFEIVVSPSSVTGISAVIEGTGFGVYPNPVVSSSTVTLSVKDKVEGSAAIQVYDMVGKLVFTDKMTVESNKVSEKAINLGLPAGVYSVKVICGGKTYTDKLIVR